MMRKSGQLRILALVAPLVVVLFAPPGGHGQEAEQPVTGYIEIGGQQLWGNVTGRPDLPFQPALSQSKLNEYRQLADAFTLKSADMKILLGGGHFLHIQARSGVASSGFLNDQSYLVAIERPGSYVVQFRWDETPHIFSNTTQFIASESSPGLFTLDPSLRSSLIAVRTDPVAVGGIFDSLLAGLPPFDMSLRRDTATLGAHVTPTPDWALGFRFSREKEDGHRPIGTYSPGFELPEPIDYRHTRIQANAEYSKRKGGFQVGYLGSFFENKVHALVWELPFSDVDAFFSTSRGRIALYPDNSAHYLNFAGALDLSDSTRVMASVVPGWMRQNDPFLPFTINPALGSFSTVDSLPARSLQGSKQTLAMNYTLVSFPVQHLEITGRYRSYDYNNNTPSLFFPAYVILDIAPTSALGAPRINRQSVPYGFNRKTFELAATLDFSGNLFKVGYEFERYDREHRDVSQSDEHTIFSSVDLNLNKLILVRFSARHSDRDPDLYVESLANFRCPDGMIPGDPVCGIPNPGPGPFRQLEEFRRFDEAARNRNRVEASVQFDPLPSFGLSASWGTTQDDYHKSAYGVLNDISRYYTFDFDYSPRPEFAFFGEYTREKYSRRLRTRILCAATPGDCSIDSGQNNSPNNDWETSTHDHVDTWATGLDIYLPKANATLTSYYSLSAAYGSILATALGDSSLPGYLLDSSLVSCRFGGCTPQDYPDTKNRIHDFVVSFKFDVTRHISPKVEYRYERYDRVDWQSQLMRPYVFSLDPSSNQQVFLGVDNPSYRGHGLSFGAEYRF